MRIFEKVSFEEFKKYFGNKQELYENYTLPKRKTKHSAGYDFELIEDITIPSNESFVIPLGVKADMNEGEFLMIVIRSSTGIKYNVRMQNQVGIIDKDYYNNVENEGHIFVKLQNQGNEEFTLKKGSSIVQGIFMSYLKTDEEVNVQKIRTGGFGSTTERT